MNISRELKTTVCSLWLGLCLASTVSAETFEPVIIDELWFTDHSPAENVDAPAVWRGPDGASWLFATAKSSHSILLKDGLNGRSIRRIGGRGAFPGQFDRPNGISVAGDYLYIVERDNRRVQIFTLPDLISRATFGSDVLEKPYSLYVLQKSDELHHVYVTDSFEGPDGELPPLAELNRRVHLFEVEINGTVVEGEHVKSFGDTSGAGILHVVESIYGDPAHGHLLIADEDEETPGARNIKIYDFAGNFTGRTVGEGFFVAQPEGIALWETGPETGYWIFTDQGKTTNRFLFFDRVDFSFKGAFYGRYLLNTDGIWLDPVPTERYPEGLFYAVDNDASVAAFCLREIRRKLGL